MRENILSFMTTVLKKSKMYFLSLTIFFHLQKPVYGEESACTGIYTYDLQLYLRLCCKINRKNKNNGFVFSCYTV